MSIGEIVHFATQTDFDVFTCRQRLTDEYLETMLFQGVPIAGANKRWRLKFFPKDDGTLKIKLNPNFMLHFLFKVAFSEKPNKTIVEVKFNPFGGHAIFMLLFVILGGILFYMFLPSEYYHRLPLIIGGWVIGFAWVGFQSARSARMVLIEYLMYALNSRKPD